MSAALSQSDAARFTIFIDALIESPRFNLSDFCKSARITAAEAVAWFRRTDIENALQSCMDFIQLSSRIRHAILDTNAMGALGQLLTSSQNEIELRRVATTIISRHKAELRKSGYPHSPSRATDPLWGQWESASRATDPLGHQRESASLPPEGAGDFCRGLRSSSAPADKPTTPLENPTTVTKLSLLAESLKLSKSPQPRAPRTAQTLRSRAGAPPPSTG
jgi:hypothetical protein